MPDLAQQFGENTIDEPISETILRDLRLVRFTPDLLLSSLPAGQPTNNFPSADVTASPRFPRSVAVS